jgi:hypothetical protein
LTRNLKIPLLSYHPLFLRPTVARSDINNVSTACK